MLDYVFQKSNEQSILLSNNCELACMIKNASDYSIFFYVFKVK